MLADVFHNDAQSFTATTGGSPPAVVHSQPYQSFWALAQDEGDSRIWGGIHFRFDQDAGTRLGRAVGSAVYKDVHDEQEIKVNIGPMNPDRVKMCPAPGIAMGWMVISASMMSSRSRA